MFGIADPGRPVERGMVFTAKQSGVRALGPNCGAPVMALAGDLSNGLTRVPVGSSPCSEAIWDSMK